MATFLHSSRPSIECTMGEHKNLPAKITIIFSHITSFNINHNQLSLLETSN